MKAKNRVSATRRGSALSASGQRRPPLLTYLRGIAASLTPAERLIADHVLADPEKVVSSSIVTARRECGASLGSIVSFCQRLGLKGFAEFKLALARELAISGLPATRAPENDPLPDKVFHFHLQCLGETRKINSRATFDRAVALLEKAHRIEFFSTGLSYPVAYTAYSKFLLIGLPASTQADSHLQLITAAQLTRGDVAFGVSCSGATRETVQCLQVAQSRGAKTICLTNALRSPITNYSDLCIYATPSEINYFQAPMASRVTQLAVMDTLFVSLALKDRARTSNRLHHSVQELLKRRLRYGSDDRI